MLLVNFFASLYLIIYAAFHNTTVRNDLKDNCVVIALNNCNNYGRQYEKGDNLTHHFDVIDGLLSCYKKWIEVKAMCQLPEDKTSPEKDVLHVGLWLAPFKTRNSQTFQLRRESWGKQGCHLSFVMVTSSKPCLWTRIKKNATNL